MIKKIALVFALFMSFTSTGFADVAATDGVSGDGANDVIEAWGGTRNGGDC